MSNDILRPTAPLFMLQNPDGTYAVSASEASRRGFAGQETPAEALIAFAEEILHYSGAAQFLGMRIFETDGYHHISDALAVANQEIERAEENAIDPDIDLDEEDEEDEEEDDEDEDEDDYEEEEEYEDIEDEDDDEEDEEDDDEEDSDY